MQRNDKSIKFISQRLLISESIVRGIKVRHINKDQDNMVFYELSYKNHFEYISGGIISKALAITNHCVTNKYLTKILLKKEYIAVSKGKIFNHKSISKIPTFIKKIGFPVVVKKNDGSFGNLVFIGIKNKAELHRAVKKILAKNDDVLIEKKFKGEEFRIIASRKKVFAVAKKEAANVVGDGIHSIKELVKIKNCDYNRGNYHYCPLTKIKIDSTVKKNLLELKIDLNYIPLKGIKTYLRKNANLSTGGESIDVTDKIHSEFKKIAIKSIKAIPGLAYGGIDLLTEKDISQKPTKNSYVILELNIYPGLRMHHYPYKGKPRNVAKEIIDILFPETKGKYIKKIKV